MNRILGKPPEYQCVGRFPTPKLRDKEELVLIVEPTGGYEQMLARFAISNGRSAVLVRPCRTNGRSAANWKYQYVKPTLRSIFRHPIVFFKTGGFREKSVHIVLCDVDAVGEVKMFKKLQILN